MNSAADADEAEVPYDTISPGDVTTSPESESEEAAQAFTKAEDDFREQRAAAINEQSAVLKQKLLRSVLIKQPEGTDRADEIIVDEIMTVADAEREKAVLSTAVEEIAYSPITVTTDSSTDCE